jgi:hypothetical protein
MVPLASLDEQSGEIEAHRKVAAKSFGLPTGKLQSFDWHYGTRI